MGKNDTLKVATWNMRRNSKAWDYLKDESNQKMKEVDIFLLQESIPQEDLIKNGSLIPQYRIDNGKEEWGIKCNKWSKPGKKRTQMWGSGIYSKHPIKEIKIPTDYEGAMVIGEVEITEDKKFTVISLHGIFEHILENSVKKAKYCITTLHRMLSDLTGILNGHIGGKRKIIIGGDFNASLQADIHWGGQYTERAHEILFQRLEDFKLHNCYEKYYNPSELQPEFTEECIENIDNCHERLAKALESDIQTKDKKTLVDFLNNQLEKRELYQKLRNKDINKPYYNRKKCEKMSPKALALFNRHLLQEFLSDGIRKKELFIQTHCNPKSKIPWQDDYIFISESLFYGKNGEDKKTCNLKNCKVIYDKKIEEEKLSDHYPVVIELEI